MARRLHVGWTSLLFGLALLLYPSVAWAQFDLVTGTVTDPNGIPYSNATVRAQLAIAGAVVNGQPTVTNPSQAQCISAGLGNAPCQMPFQGTQSFSLDVNGNIPNGGISLANNPSVTPAGTQWLFSVTISPGITPPAGTGPQSFSVAVTISTNPQNIGAALTAAAPKLSNLASGTALVNVVSSNPGTCTTGQVFFNTSTNQLLVCSSTNTLTVVGGTGSVTSVNTTVPPQFNTSGCLITSAGTCAIGLQPEYPDTVFAGPALNAIGGIYDGAVNGVANSTTSLSLSLTPNFSNDLAFFVVDADSGISQATAVAMTGSGTWTNVFTNGNFGALFTQLLTTNSPLTAAGNLPTATNWAGVMFFLRANGTPVVVQTQLVSGAIVSPTTNTFLSNTSPGNTILACIVGSPSTISSVNATITDTQGNNYTPVANQQNPNGSGGGEGVFCWASANLVGATHDAITFRSITGPGVSGTFAIMEISGIAISTGVPTFRPLILSDLPAAVASPPVRQLLTQTLGSNVSGGTTQVTVLSQSMTMPVSGCPCRAFISYSLYVSWGTGAVATDFWISDGTNVFGSLQTGNTNAGAGGRNSASWAGFSSVTYANSQSVTFTLLTQGTSGAVYTIEATPQTGGGGNSNMQTSVISSN
jgi:hypothetical protein